MLGAVGWMVPPPQKVMFKHDTCECDLIWKQGLCRCNQDEVTLEQSDPTSNMTDVLMRRDLD